MFYLIGWEQNTMCIGDDGGPAIYEDPLTTINGQPLSFLAGIGSEYFTTMYGKMDFLSKSYHLSSRGVLKLKFS